MVLKELEKFNQDPKGCLQHEEKTKVLLIPFYRLLDCPKVNFGLLSTFEPERGAEGHEKYIFPLKIVFP